MIELVGSFGFPTRITPLGPTSAAADPKPQPAHNAAVTATDSVELESTFRSARVRAVREEILAGNFETSERIDGTVNRLLDVIA